MSHRVIQVRRYRINTVLYYIEMMGTLLLLSFVIIQFSGSYQSECALKLLRMIATETIMTTTW